MQQENNIKITKNFTIPKLFLMQAEKFGDGKVAMREKEFGIWRTITWSDYLKNVKHIALGLISLGLKKDDKVSMIGDNRPEGLMAEVGAICAGGTAVWLFRDSLNEEVKYIIDHSDTKFLIAETQEEVDKAILILKECPKLKKIIWDNPKGMRNYRQDYLISLKEVKALGEKLDKEKPQLFKEIVSKGNGDDTAFLFYTSGTTSLPKGALLTHYNMLTKMTRDVQVKYLDSAWIKRKFYKFANKVGYNVASLKFDKKPVPWYMTLLDKIAYITVQKKLKDRLGLSNIRNAYTGGAAMGPDTIKIRKRP